MSQIQQLQLVAINTKEKRNERKERKRKGTLDSMLETEFFENGNRQNGMAISIFKTVSEVDNNFRANAHENTIMADSNKCGVELKRQENYEDLIQNIANKKQEFQKTNSKVSTGSRFRELPSLSSGQLWEFGKESRVLAVQELRQSKYIVPSSDTDTRITNQNFCNNDKNIKNETILQELQNGDGMQNTNDLASLIRLLKDKEQYREETNKDVFTKGEIYLFTETYGITDFKLMFACDDSIFWLEDHGIIYFWSRIDDSMIRGGRNLKEALTNYLFNQKNLCYVDEITRELIPINAYD
ncbi:unnamed protein product [Rhizophagus irregularis]|nr:unnamed protein product [Rhizophagus irregularis]